MDLQFEWKRLKEGIRLAEGADPVEEAMAARLWKYLGSVLGKTEGRPRNGESVLMEEIVCLRVAAWRLERILWSDGLFPARKEGGGTGPVHPGVEALAKTRERYRKAMKDFLDRFEETEGAPDGGFAEAVARVLKKGEGVFEDVMEIEAREKKIPAQEARDDEGRD